MSKIVEIDNIPTYIVHPKTQIKGGMIVVHEVWGLTDHIKSVANRIAEQGYLVYAPDLLSHTDLAEKMTSELQSDFFNPEKRNMVQPKVRELMAPIQAPEFAIETVASLKKLFNHLYSQPECQQKVGIIGFCFGGTYSFNLAVEEPRLIATVPFYGHADQPVDELESIQTPIQAFYGEKDEALISKLPALENRMNQAGVEFNYQVYANCGHAFFNDTNPYAYNKQAALDAWQTTIKFLELQFSR